MTRGVLSEVGRLRARVTKLAKGISARDTRIEELEQLVAEQAREIALLKEKLVDKEAQRKELLSYLYKPGKKEGTALPRGKVPGAQGFHRPAPKDRDVTEFCEYLLHKCPMCSREVGPAVDTVIKYEEDIALTPRPIIKKHTITRHWCSHCETLVKSKNIPETARIGINVMGYALYARYRLRLPIERIQESLRDLYNFHVSEGEIVQKLKETEELFGKDHEMITLLIQEATRVYVDETGWKMDGKNWWLWVFVTERGVQYVIEDTRGKGVPERVLGGKVNRVIISDGYAAYQNIPGDKQQCWVHLLRKAKLHSTLLYEDLVLLYKKLLLELEKPLEARDKKKFEEQLDVLIKKKYQDPDVHLLKNRMEKHKPFLFTCLDYHGVLPENNTAERAIRPQVVMRKIFGGSRSLAGAKAHQVNSSVVETLRRQNSNASFFEVILPLLERRRSGW